MVFGTKRQIEEADSERFQLGPDEIRVTRDYKYLGCEASAFLGKPTSVIDRLVRVSSSPSSVLFRLRHGATSCALATCATSAPWTQNGRWPRISTSMRGG
jgi:hypothetical protein